MKKQIIIHAGFHRCASTAIQWMLRRHRTAIEAGGTSLIVRDQLKAGAFAKNLRLLYRHSGWSPVCRYRLGVARRGFEAIENNRVLVSEECLPGLMPGLDGASFYPGFGRFLAALEMLSRHFDFLPRFVVRRQDAFLESAYAFRLMRGMNLSFKEFVASIGAETLSWRNLLAQVERSRLAPNSRFAVLEAWPGHSSGQEALAFLGQDNVAGNGEVRMTGNTSMAQNGRRLLLAMNRMGLAGDQVWRKENLLSVLSDDYVLSGNLEAAGLEITTDQKAALDRAIAEQIPVGFSGEARRDFMKQYEVDNQAFLARPIVAADTNVWQG